MAEGSSQDFQCWEGEGDRQHINKQENYRFPEVVWRKREAGEGRRQLFPIKNVPSDKVTLEQRSEDGEGVSLISGIKFQARGRVCAKPLFQEHTRYV